MVETSVGIAGAEIKSLTFTVDKTKKVISFTGVDNNSYNKYSKEVAVVVIESNYGNNTVDLIVPRFDIT